MKVSLSKTFEKHFNKRIASHSNLLTKFEDRFNIFKKSPNNPTLRNHSLGGTLQGYRAFSITGDIRVIYKQIDEDHIEFLDIGSHNQV